MIFKRRHRCVCYLIPEFQRGALETLRQPLESGQIAVARANAHVTYPARVQLVAAMNPCRCGHLDDPAQACSRAPKCAGDYQQRISGPLFDRIDLHVEVPAVKAADLSLPPPAEGSAEVAARVAAARQVQRERFQSQGLATNAEADGEQLEAVAAPDAAGRAPHRGGRAPEALGPRLPPRAARGPHAGRPCGGGGRQAPAHRRGAELPADRAGQGVGIMAWILDAGPESTRSRLASGGLRLSAQRSDASKGERRR